MLYPYFYAYANTGAEQPKPRCKRWVEGIVQTKTAKKFAKHAKSKLLVYKYYRLLILWLRNLTLPCAVRILHMHKLLLVILFIILTTLPEKVISQISTSTGQKDEIVTNPAIRENLISFAKGFMGVPYRYASAAPENGFDCSGFVHYIFKSFDIVVPHSSKAFKNMGKILKPEEFKIGDVLVFYGYRNASEIGHVGIICEADGMNSKFIHSSSGKIKGVIISSLNSSQYKKRYYQCVDLMSP